MQAQGGVMRAQGDPNDEPVYLQIAVCDYATALTAAYGITAALVARERTGLGDRVETCLANASFTVQAGEYIFYDGRPHSPLGGRDLAGRNAVYRVYPTLDGSMMLACRTSAHVERLLAAVADADAASTPAVNAADVPSPLRALPPGSPWETNGALATKLAGAFAARSTADWIAALRARDVPAAPCLAVTDLFDDAHTCANDLWWDMEDPRWGAVRQTGALIKWDAMSMALIRRAPQLGEHTLEVLRESGVEDARLDGLTASGVVRQLAR
jgi:formyl-CoA transferase